MSWDLRINGGMLVDGSGRDPYRADVAVRAFPLALVAGASQRREGFRESGTSRWRAGLSGSTQMSGAGGALSLLPPPF